MHVYNMIKSNEGYEKVGKICEEHGDYKLAKLFRKGAQCFREVDEILAS